MEHECMGPKLTQAEGFILGVSAKMFSCCGARQKFRLTSRLISCRPLPLAQVASSATGGAPIAPHRRSCHRLRRFGIGGVWVYLLDNPFLMDDGQFCISYVCRLQYGRFCVTMQILFHKEWCAMKTYTIVAGVNGRVTARRLLP